MLPSFEIEQNKQLQKLHTFGVPWRSQFFVRVTDTVQLHDVLEIARGQSQKIFVLGGGSNILPTENFHGLVIANSISGRSVIEEDDTEIVIEFGAGESWHDTVMWCVEHNFHGLENLALIPGTVGGAVVQNIGAYDSEISDLIESVICIESGTRVSSSYSNNQCEFEYRNSIFKRELGQHIITSVRMRLQKTFKPILSYEPLRVLRKNENLQAKDVTQNIIELRRSKLPDWNVIGTAGSFFANPRVSEKIARKLQKKNKDMPVFTDKKTGEKIIPAGWLIENSKLNKKIRNKFLYHKHALVLVNNHKANGGTPIKYGKEIFHASRMIVNRVEKDFGISLEREILIVE